MDLERIRNGRFIHDELAQRAALAVGSLPAMWRTDKQIHPSILLWPEDTVRTTTGRDFSGVVFSELPDDAGERKTFIERSVKQVGAYAVLVIEEVPGAVRCVFESQHGTETWRLPIKDHGGARVLGVAAKRSNAESLGVLWHAN